LSSGEHYRNQVRYVRTVAREPEGTEHRMQAARPKGRKKRENVVGQVSAQCKIKGRRWRFRLLKDCLCVCLFREWTSHPSEMEFLLSIFVQQRLYVNNGWAVHSECYLMSHCVLSTASG